MPGQNTNFLALRRHELIPVRPAGSFTLNSSRIADGMMTLWPRRIILFYVGLSVRHNNRNKELASLAQCLHLAAGSSSKTDLHLVQLRRESHQVDHFDGWKREIVHRNLLRLLRVW